MYSSRTSAWSAPAPHINDNLYDLEKRLPSLVIEDALYFTLRCDVNILIYDLGRHRLSLVDTPPTEVFEPIPIETVDGQLGFVAFSYHPRSCIYMWSRRQVAGCGGANGGIIGGAAAWERHRIVELDALLPNPV